MNIIWKGSLLIALVFISGTAGIGRADCVCGNNFPGPCDYSCAPDACDYSCDTGCDTGCGGDYYIYKDACSSLQATDDGYLWTFGRGRCAQTYRFDGWIESGIMTNSHGTTHTAKGYGGNGPMHTRGNRRTDYTVSQVSLLGEKVMDTSRGFDWGFRTNFVYGSDGPSMQSSGDRTFDYDWATNDHRYGLACYQLFGTVGYKNLSVRGGKFITPIGWEESLSKNNFFYSHSYCYWIEPATHTGVLADYAVNDCLTLKGGWTAGMDNGFGNRFGSSAYLLGFNYALTKKASIYYYINQGDQYNGMFSNGEWAMEDFGSVTIPEDKIDKVRYFVQSFVFEWNPTKRFTYMMQYNLRNDTVHSIVPATPKDQSSSYGINNHFLYQLTDKLGVGMRLEWLRDNSGYYVAAPETDYYQMTYGLKWDPNRHWSVRPEVRFDQANGSTPFAAGRKSSQITGGVGVLYIF